MFTVVSFAILKRGEYKMTELTEDKRFEQAKTFLKFMEMDSLVEFVEEIEELIYELRSNQYYSRLSVDEVVFNNKEFCESLAKFEMICALFKENPKEMSLEIIDTKFKRKNKQ